MRILSIGTFSSFGISNTCLHRTWALERFNDVRRIDSTLKNNILWYRIVNRLFVRYRLPIRFYNRLLAKEIRQEIQTNEYDIVWIDKGIFIEPNVLKFIKQRQPHCLIVGFSPDNMDERHNQSQLYLESFPFYDCHITTKSYIIQALKDMGGKRILFTNKTYEQTFHHPYKLSLEEKERLGGKVGFIGAWEEERCRSILYLAKNGIPVRVWGGGRWLHYKGLYPNLVIEGCGLFTDDYPKALAAFDISLCFLRKINYDLQTARTMEIPACGSLLVAERTSEHEQLFQDGKEAVFFSSDEELLERVQYYLTHEEERLAIAEAGMMRCKISGYSNDATMRRLLKEVLA